MNPAIVISAYNRPHTLTRLLANIRNAVYDDRDVPLVISIDGSAAEERRQVLDVARQFDWPFGAKRVIDHGGHLGLIGHFFACGDLSAEYGAVILLEDDLGMSPVFYRYAARALECYGADPRIAGLCLYALWFNGYTREPFVPLADGGDAFFLQVPYTQGQAWSAAQWQRFAAWRAAGEHAAAPDGRLHDAFRRFAPDDWFPLMAQYVVESGQFVSYPRVSLASGMGDAGTHFARPTRFLHTPLLLNKESFAFLPLDDALAMYDAFFEVCPERLNRLTDTLAGVEYDVDLYATKRPRHLHAPYVLTTRPARTAARAFGRSLWPHEMNVVAQTPGAEIALCRRDDLRWGRWADLRARKASHDYFTRGQRPGRRAALLYALLDAFERRR